MVQQHDVIEFVREHFPYLEDYTDDQINNIILEHIKYGTISILLDKGKIIGLLRINVFGNIVDVCDMAVREGYDLRKVLREMTLELWQRFPYTKYCRFYRNMKYPLKRPSIYTIKRLMKV